MTSKPKNFRSAIDELENEIESNGNGHGPDIRARLEQELHRIEEALNKLKPHLSEEFQASKAKVETEIQKNPWAAVGIVALVAFILGLLLSPKGRSRD